MPHEAALAALYALADEMADDELGDYAARLRELVDGIRPFVMPTAPEPPVEDDISDELPALERVDEESVEAIDERNQAIVATQERAVRTAGGVGMLPTDARAADEAVEEDA